MTPLIYLSLLRLAESRLRDVPGESLWARCHRRAVRNALRLLIREATAVMANDEAAR